MTEIIPPEKVFVELSYRCPVCKMVFNSSKDYEEHYTSKHSTDLANMVGRAFSSRDSLGDMAFVLCVNKDCETVEFITATSIAIRTVINDFVNNYIVEQPYSYNDFRKRVEELYDRKKYNALFALDDMFRTSLGDKA